ATKCPVSFHQDHGPGNPVLDQGQDSETAGERFMHTGGIRSHSGGTRSRPLPTWDSLLRATRAPVQSSDIFRSVLVVGTIKAPSPTTIELGIIAAKGLWNGSPDRSQRSTDALGWPAKASDLR